MNRRDLLKLLSLSTLAVAAAPLLSGCGADEPAPGVTIEGVDLVAADVPRAAGDPGAIAAVVAAMHATGGALLGTLGAGEQGNVAISPYSVAAALALTANGARGRTLAQLAPVLGGTRGIEEVNGGLNALTSHVESLAGPVEKSDGTRTELALDAANAVFGQQGTTWERPFLETLAASYGAGMNTVDWTGATEAARGAVNAWTAEQTADRVEEILPEGSVTTDTRLVLVNTVYLKAPWDRPFDTDRTEDGPFALLDGSSVEVPLMSSAEPTGDAYAEGDGWAAARLPYAGEGVAMTVVVPDAGRFAEVEADLVARGASGYLDALQADRVVVTLPSWTFRFHRSLVAGLKALGVEDLFDSAADLSAMTTDERLLVSGVEHEVFIAVDEEGTEAAAATAVVVGATSAPLSVELVVDRPFLFVVHDVEHGTPLFLGRVVDPRG